MQKDGKGVQCMRVERERLDLSEWIEKRFGKNIRK